MAFHFLFIAFALLGSLLVLWKRWIMWLHVPALAWGAWIEASGRICPLTPLENHFRELAGQTTYGEGFITHYLGPDHLSRRAHARTCTVPDPGHTGRRESHRLWIGDRTTCAPARPEIGELRL